MPAALRRAVFLDRDGVLNRAHIRNGRPYPPASLAELELLPGSAQACDDLHAAGFALIVVTNQPDIARGTQSTDAVDAIHHALQRQLPLDAVYVCPHDDGDRCSCRKPAPGLLLSAAVAHGVDLGASFMVGDRWRDVEAGRRAGCRTILLESSYTERRAERPDKVVTSLLEASDWIRCLQGHHQEASVG
jgi:D-glycero-D-manno-heptose 1,7-bisphosphate phosphatase